MTRLEGAEQNPASVNHDGEVDTFVHIARANQLPQAIFTTSLRRSAMIRALQDSRAIPQ